jgi:ribosome-binding protein aMBF1 (putative translation factor)
MKLGEIIREARKGKGLQQEDLAQKVGSNQAYISCIEIYVEPDFSTACRVLEALDLNIKETWEKMRSQKKEKAEAPSR